MARKEKMPKFSGFRMTKDGLGPPVYEVTMTVAPDDYGVSHSATNREMVHGVFNHVNGEIDALRARAEAAEQRAEAAEARLAAARAAWHDAVENFDNIDRHGEATEICEWACALRDALADAEPDWGTAGGVR